MEKFINDGNNQRIIKIKDDKPDNVPMNDAYIEYAIPYNDISGLIEVLKSKGDIKIEEVKQGGPCPTTTITAVYDKPEQIINTQANIIDKQLNIIQSFLVK